MAAAGYGRRIRRGEEVAERIAGPFDAPLCMADQDAHVLVTARA